MGIFLSSKENESLPQSILLPDQSSIQSIGCGFNCTIILTSDHHLYGWGRNEYGQLGVNDCEKEKINSIDD